MRKLIKNVIFDSKEIIVTYFFSYGIVVGACVIYSLMGFKNLDVFINYGCVIILLVYYITVIGYLYYKNKKFVNKKMSLSIQEIYPLLSLGISIAVFINMIIFFVLPPNHTSTIVMPLLFLSSGIIGPIYEEMLFRFLLYNRLKQQYSIKKATIITTILFALIHLSFVKMIYAFVLGFLLVKVYEDKKNIWAPILVHIGANSIVVILNEYNTYVLLLSIICLLLGGWSYLLIKKETIS